MIKEVEEETISYNREEIDRMRSASIDWLKKAIGEANVRRVRDV